MSADATSGRALGAVAACAALLAISATAAAQPVERAVRRYLDADFGGARSGFRAVLASRALRRADAVEAHRYLAALELAFGNRAAARDHVAAALALAPNVEPPSGAEDLEPVVREVRASLRGTPSGVQLSVPEPLVAGRPGRVVVSVAPASRVLASRLLLRCGGEVRAEGALPALSADVRPLAPRLECTAEVVTSAGVVLLSATRSFWARGARRDTAGVAAQHDGGDGDRGGSGLPLWPFLAGGGALVAIATVVVIAVVAAPEPRQALLGTPRVDGW